MKVKEAMHKGVEWRKPTTPISEIAKVMKENDVGAVPIGENDRLVGMITDRDIACRAGCLCLGHSTYGGDDGGSVYCWD